MLVLAQRIEHPLNVTVQRPHYADPREHRRSAHRRDQDQGFHRCLPLRGRVLGLGQPGDVGTGVLQRDELTTARQRDRFVEWPFPALGRATRRDQRPPA